MFPRTCQVVPSARRAASANAGGGLRDGAGLVLGSDVKAAKLGPRATLSATMRSGWSIAAGVGLIAAAMVAACQTVAPAPPERDGCENIQCPSKTGCAPGKVLVRLEGDCCDSCATLPVDAGDGCLCSPERDAVCGEDHVLYHNRCFADCAGVAVIATGSCPSRAEFPPGNYDEPCTSDSQCDAPYECLPWARGGTPDPTQTVCTRRCDVVEDCPKVVSDHCGDQTQCGDGICGYFVCL